MRFACGLFLFLSDFFSLKKTEKASSFSFLGSYVSLNPPEPSAAFVRVVVGIRMPFKPSECLASQCLPRSVPFRELD